MPSEVALEYAAALRELFASRDGSEDRGTGGPADSATAAAAAEKAVRLGDPLTASLALGLSAPDPDQRAYAASQLLAKALSDLESSAYLKAVADDEAAGMRSVQASSDRTVRVTAIETYLDIILESTPAVPAADRSERVLMDPIHAREDLSVRVEDSLSLIVDRAVEIAKITFEKLTSLGFAEIVKAAGIVGSGLVGALGLSDKLGTLYRLCRDFALKAYNAITSLLGDALAKIAGEKVTAWVKEHTNKDYLAAWLKSQYGISEKAAALKAKITASSADVSRIGTASNKVDILSSQFGRQIDLLKKLLKGIDYIRMIPGITTPQGISLLAASYIVICGYVVFDAADYLDAEALEVLNRVVGIPTVIQGSI